MDVDENLKQLNIFDGGKSEGCNQKHLIFRALSTVKLSDLVHIIRPST